MTEDRILSVDIAKAIFQVNLILIDPGGRGKPALSLGSLFSGWSSEAIHMKKRFS